jgi:hypothetical protein
MSNFLARLRGNRTYIFATAMTAFALIGLYTGKCDFATASELIMTAGLGSCIRSGVQTRAEPGFGTGTADDHEDAH